ALLAADLEGEELLRALQQHPAGEYLLVEPGDGAVYGVLAAADVERVLSGAPGSPPRS
ncbi:MAG: site-2 protease family protein, partial [Actinomycetota bacterium]|nr:site-2 protease family protein [Actinomycetota bacterium]